MIETSHEKNYQIESNRLVSTFFQIDFLNLLFQADVRSCLKSQFILNQRFDTPCSNQDYSLLIPCAMI